ncbi:SIR2 family protein [Parabacteroides sp. OttesenSCG-928-G07]|nr:SIR2 family protein [Parabacteroides sp. OttesenSCG-928-G07]
MNNIITTISFSVFSNKGVYALLLGSGISKKSGIPTGWDIVIDLIKKLAKINKEECASNPEEWFIKKYNQEPNYSTILSKLVKSPTERVNFLRQYFEPTAEEIEQGLKQPTKTHKLIASLVKKGYIKVIITTNFDRLLENALLLEGIEPTVIRHPDDIDGAIPLVHNDFVLVKVNGDYLDSRFLNTQEELTNYSKKIEDYVLRIINEFGIISCGWSAKWDVGLVNILRKSENFRFSSYWTHLGTCESELDEIAKLRKGQIVQIENSDVFFNELSDNIDSLENLNSNHPLTTDIAIARLKKYIVKPEYKILLHDLFQDQLKESLKIIRVKDDIGLYPDRVHLYPVLEHYVFSFENLIHLIINGVYWADKSHYYLFVEILRKISEPPKSYSGSFYDDTRKLLYFPSLLALYTIGISAIIRNNFELLNMCFHLRIRESDSSYSDDMYLIEKANPCMVGSEIMNGIIGQNYHTPMSTFVERTLVSYFEKYSITEKEFQDSFDKFEYLFSLNFLDIVEKKYGHDWTPWGAFKWRRNYRVKEKDIIEMFLQESTEKKSEWSPIKAGMFNGKYERFNEIKTRTDNFLKEIHLH